MLVDTDVLIIGAGLSGVGFAIRLQQKYPRTSFEIYEKDEQLGGTWWANTYPGCACDVPSHLYSYSFALNPDWSAQFSSQPEIAAYCRAVAEEHDIPRHITFRSTVQAAVFDEPSGTWAVRILDQQTGQIYERRARVLISAVGLLSEPNDCEIPGAEEYKGRLFHSARWDHGFEWEGKDVVVVGNGCSATQFVPILTNTPGSAKSVTQFIRQPHWLEPRPNPVYPAAVKWVFRHVPLVMRCFRYAIFLYLESYFSTFKVVEGRKTRGQRMRSQIAYLKKMAPEKYYDMLIPMMELGCKRRVMDTDYLACLHRENMELVRHDPIERITAHGVRTESGREVHADAIVLATGFKGSQPLFPLGNEIRGEGGVSIMEDQHSARPQRILRHLRLALPKPLHPRRTEYSDGPYIRAVHRGMPDRVYAQGARSYTGFSAPMPIQAIRRIEAVPVHLEAVHAPSEDSEQAEYSLPYTPRRGKGEPVG
ncbi:uncharacterized protein DSM5745_04079 [Aspergillus mulundensis]|uniref:L-ornithine N(5)-oxygenase n=1 Tax=Aspergillus mulundensis TaxID=1810919 RepID=A0A3D8SBU7_9EURO|nr:Uncharacterized protein DSM5745_04079 [Aspergillus mulundensis]RDW83753.1 Uncharacterized protein DSM5745_04079 [Aspergillus mulundensis]